MLSLSFSTISFIVSILCSTSAGHYVLQDDYTQNFFDQFDFWTDRDPTNGFVDYVSRAAAERSGLISTSNGIYFGVDYENTVTSGRKSVRLTSKKVYNKGLFIIDLKHMPGSVCGSWPAFWMVGNSWPNDGEIDIIEGVNAQTTNLMTLHTSSGCTITNNNMFTGKIETSNCDINAEGQPNNAGCGISSNITTSYGDGFNAAGGGVYATEWANNYISIWHFPRANIPSDIANGAPDPTTWGAPAAMFQGGCNIPRFFNNLHIVFDITFCGDWAGNVWTSGSCSSKAPTCNSYVANNPSVFRESYWAVNSLNAYRYEGRSTCLLPGSYPPSKTSSSQHSLPYLRGQTVL